MRPAGEAESTADILERAAAGRRFGHQALLARVETMPPADGAPTPRFVTMPARLEQLVGHQPRWVEGLTVDEVLPGLDPHVLVAVARNGIPKTTAQAVIVRPGQAGDEATHLLVLPAIALTRPTRDGEPESTVDAYPDLDDVEDPLFELAFTGAPVGMAVTAADGVLLRVNTALADLLGRSAADLIGVSLDTISAADEVLDAAARAGTSDAGPARSEPRSDGPAGGAAGASSFRGGVDRRLPPAAAPARPFVHRAGRIVWLRVSPAEVDCELVRLTVNHFVDVTAERRVARQMAHAATHDELTGLPNRAWLLAALQTALNAGSPTALALGGRTPAVLFVDLDDFKIVNDSLGHDAGDRLLRQIAQRLRRTVRPEDAVARFGGDELVILCQDLPAGDAADQLCRRLLATISEPVEVDGRAITVGASIGVAHADPTSTPQSLLRDADSAMYSAKRGGRNGYVISDDLLRGFALAALTEEVELRTALDNRLLELQISPIRRLSTLRISAVDAVLAWRHPVRGLLEPGYSVGLAARTGLSHNIGQFVLDEAFRRLPEWRQQSGERKLRVNIQLPVEHLVHPDVVDDVRHALQRHRVDPRSVMIEVPERALINDSRTVLEHLEKLSEDGIRLVLADFGSGYSALSLLRKLPIGSLELDRIFVANARQGGRDAVLLRSITTLGSALGLDVRATGVDNLGDLRAAEAAGCTHAQGAFVGRPGDRADWPQPAEEEPEPEDSPDNVVRLTGRSRRP